LQDRGIGVCFERAVTVKGKKSRRRLINHWFGERGVRAPKGVFGIPKARVNGLGTTPASGEGRRAHKESPKGRLPVSSLFTLWFSIAAGGGFMGSAKSRTRALSGKRGKGLTCSVV